MELRSLTGTSLQVTPMGLGLAALGRPGYINVGHRQDLPASSDVDALREHAHDVLDGAYAAGIRYFDAARSYGRAEEFLRSWLDRRGLTSSDVTVGSKWGYAYTADWRRQLPPGEKHEVKDHSLPLLDRQVRETRETLGDHLDLYQIHSATLESRVLENEAVLSRLAGLRDQGLVIGFSTSGPAQADTIRRGLAIERGGRPLFESVQATWNLLEQSAGAALAEAHSAGRGVIVKEALANGRLTARNNDDRLRPGNPALCEFLDRSGASMDAVALACAVRQPWADIVLSGAATSEHLRSNLTALELADRPELEALLESPESPDAYWSLRAELPWN